MKINALRPLGAFAFLVSLIGVCGCEPDVAPVSIRATAPSQPASKHLELALDYLDRLEEFEKPQAMVQSTYHLNRWISSQELAAEWHPDEMIKTLPRIIRESPQIQKLGAMQFVPSDADDILESLWLGEIAAWVGSREIPSPLAEDLRKQASELPSAESDQLVIAHRLFDWTIRSVQIQELLEYPAEAVAIGTADASGEFIPPPQRAIPGPGYQYYPWQVILFGHGDALNRARVFSLLARQHGIPVVMLAFPGQTTPPRPRPWVSAALIGQQLYLFDCQLGLPIPGPEGRSVATLEEVLDDTTLLSDLDVGDEFDYQVAERDLKSIQALIDASAASLSRKMQVIEGALTGDLRLILTDTPSEVAKRLQECRGIEDVSLWALPYETEWFQSEIRKIIKSNVQATSEYYRRYGIFETRNGLVRARYHHFHGKFANDGDRKGAKMLYLESRTPNRQINEVETSKAIQQAFGLYRSDDEHEIIWQARLSASREMITQAKAFASFWLGLAHYDDGRYASAIEWLKGRTLEVQPPGPFQHSAAYNLGRAYEAIGDIEAARELYLTDDSPQQHGNFLRARLLRKHR